MLCFQHRKSSEYFCNSVLWLWSVCLHIWNQGYYEIGHELLLITYPVLYRNHGLAWEIFTGQITSLDVGSRHLTVLEQVLTILNCTAGDAKHVTCGMKVFFYKRCISYVAWRRKQQVNLAVYTRLHDAQTTLMYPRTAARICESCRLTWRLVFLFLGITDENPKSMIVSRPRLTLTIGGIRYAEKARDDTFFDVMTPLGL